MTELCYQTMSGECNYSWLPRILFMVPKSDKYTRYEKN